MNGQIRDWLESLKTFADNLAMSLEEAADVLDRMQVKKAAAELKEKANVPEPRGVQ